MRYQITADRLRIALEKANMTQQELAEKSGIGKSSISHYVNGSNEPGNKSAYAMANALGVNPAWLMGLDAPMIAQKKVASKKEFVEVAFPDADKETKEKLDEYYDFFIRLSSAPEETQKVVETILKSVLPKP